MFVSRKRQTVYRLFAMPLYFVAVWLSQTAWANATTDESRRPITALDLANVQDIGGHHLGTMSVSPDGRSVAFQLQSPNIKARNYDLTWHVIETKPNGMHRKVDDGGDLILNPDKSWLTNGNRMPVEAQWSFDSNWVFYAKRINGSTQLWRSKRDGSLSERLTHNEADILSFRVSENEGKVFFTTAIPENELSKQLQQEGDVGFLYDDRFYPSRQQSPFIRACGVDKEGYPQNVGIGRACTPPLWVYDIDGKVERKATPEEIEAYRQRSIFASSWSRAQTYSDKFLINEDRKSGNAIWLENEDPEKFPGWLPPMRLFASMNGNVFRCSAKECSAVKYGIKRAWWRIGSDEIVIERSDGPNDSMSGLYAWRPGSDEIRRIIQTEDLLSGCEGSGSRVICLREQWTHPRSIVSVNLDNGKMETLYDPNPAFGEIAFSKIGKVEWEDEFGNPTHGHLVYPLNYEPGRRYPLVITTYRSFGFLRGAVGDEYPIHLLAANGFMVLSHDMPHMYKRYAQHPFTILSQFEDNYERRASLSSQEKILDILDERGLIDPERVAITGLSDGASQVMFALIHTNRIAAAIASGVSDWSSAYYSRSEKGRVFLRRVMGGAPYEDKEGLYKSLSIGLNADRVHAPLLINVSDYELLNSVEPFVRLQDAGRPVEMYVFPGEYHIKWQPQHRLAIYRRNVQWLKFWLMHEEEPRPVDPDQYNRWRKMRDEQCERLKADDPPSYCRH